MSFVFTGISPDVKGVGYFVEILGEKWVKPVYM